MNNLGTQMKMSRRFILSLTTLVFLICAFEVDAGAQRPTTATRSATSGMTQSAAEAGPQTIQPEELANILKSGKGPKPLIFQVGFHVLYVQAHIPGSEYIGAASEPDGIRRLRNRVENLRRTEPIVLYCGCCPWSQCPNINPAYKELRSLGFNSVKILYIAHNFGADWVDKGYPVAK
jgi:thiosulfate/3-mercaptopyruvate sulfurtransferase